MKILICDDSNMKFESIRGAILSLNSKAEITRVSYAKAAINELKQNKYDFLIQDMQLPLMSGDRIDIKGGLYVLNQIELSDIDVKYCICSSDSNSYRFMLEAGFKDTTFIDFSSSFFYNDLKEFLKVGE